MEGQIKAFFVGLSGMVLGAAGLFLGYDRMISKYENSLTCPIKTYVIHYDKKDGRFKKSLMESYKIFPKEAKKTLTSLNSIIKGEDFNGDGIEDKVEIKETYNGSTNLVLINIPHYHKHLIINGKKIFEFNNENVGFEKPEDKNKDGIKDIVVTSIDHVYY